MQAFKRLFYCIYVSLTIAFKGTAWDCVAGEPLRGRAAACKPKRSAACWQTVGRAKAKRRPRMGTDKQ